MITIQSPRFMLTRVHSQHTVPYTDTARITINEPTKRANEPKTSEATV